MIENKYRPKKISFSLQRILIIVTTIILMMITFMINVNGSDPQYTFKALSVYGVVVYGWFVISWIKLEKDLISIYVFFMLFSVLFYLGQPIAFLLGADNSSLNVYSIKLYPYSLLNETLVFVLISYMLIHIGAVIAKSNSNDIVKISQSNKDYSNSMNFIGIVLLLLSTVPTGILIINSLRAVLTKGYIGLFISTNTIAVNGGLLGVTAGFFMPSLYLLLIANSNKKYKRRLYTFIFFLYIIVVFMLGRRGENSIYLLGYILISHNLIKPLKGKKLFRIIMVGVLMVFVLSIISQARAYLNSGNFGEVITKSILNTSLIGIIRDVFSEFGMTLLVPATIIDKVPEVIPFYHGKTIVNFFLVLIPNVFWEVNPGLVDGTLESLVSPFIRRGTVGGIGGSFIAELYYNFGYFSYLFLPIYGIVLTRLTKFLDLRTCNTNKLKFFLSIYMFTNIIWIIRSEILTSGKDILYFAIFPIVLVKFIDKFRKNTHKKSVSKKGMVN